MYFGALFSIFARQGGVARVLVNGTAIKATAHTLAHSLIADAPNVVSLLLDVLKLAAVAPRVAEALVLDYKAMAAHAELCVQRSLPGVVIRLYLRPTTVPYPHAALTTLAHLTRLPGGLFRATVRVLAVADATSAVVSSTWQCVVCDGCPFAPDVEHDEPCSRCGRLMAEDLGARVQVPEQQAIVCLLGDHIGDRVEQRHVMLLLRDDLLSTLFQPRVGDTALVVGFPTHVTAPAGRLSRCIHAVFAARLHPAPIGASLVAAAARGPPRSFSSWTRALCDRFIDASLCETGSTLCFRLMLLLSCVVAQSRSTKQNLHLLVVGDVLHDAARLVSAASLLVANRLRCCSVEQLVPAGLALSQRGVCEVQDLLLAVGARASGARKLRHVLETHEANSCGTLWALAPVFG